ncbi:LbetaH domain-containing protein [Phaeobacter gallaeciensis]|uniref:Phosphonate metabolim protein, transferase hexapeptide repeat protein family n=1 Tax=Phaeobacter gallaeciensis TaxID=60890 RepID=A0AAD0EE40_9RHOB|nr:phosphonate metabolim protein [Phaeobacter gallaeciensis]AHD10808.1 phosphonate metabolim protein, transferase hexapeptide repeat protein family [Phaeobacter gallaeciensis DSM 26640]ATE94071.1 phosphonate metabolim protein, transferase hexapeptide repeat protein family [Phaeobacter gallaeciensis]ATE96108.1 phosphonate metabolim protein, transferase hexapeptide repeat protein family [Phaeobacter gallaeciensis]ATF02735.1 phosphonate metabolim protein, transferase hexapeptide repeat protein fam
MPRLSADHPYLHPNCAVTNSEFGAFVEIGADSRVLNSQFGDYSYCDRNCDIANARIGKFSNIASTTRIGATDHPLQKASLHHFLYRSSHYWEDIEDDAAWFDHRASRLAHIGHDTWIGHGALIKPEVTIGHGAVVAAGAVVTKDVAPYTIVGGNTARLIRRRYSESVADRMMALAWWNWDHARLRATVPDFRLLCAEAFLEKYELTLVDASVSERPG